MRCGSAGIKKTLQGRLQVVFIDVSCFEDFPLVSHEMFHHAFCPWCIKCYSSTLVPHMFCKICKILVVEWWSVISTQFVGDAEAHQDLVHCQNDG